MVIARTWHHLVLRILCVLSAACVIALGVTAPAAARNVPGSAAVAQSEVDVAVGSSILDSVLSFSSSAVCDDYLDKKEGERRGDVCTTGLSLGGGVLALQDAPDGYTFDYSAAYSTMIISQRLNSGVVIFGGLIGEAGSGILDYNDGTLEHYGIGATAGASFALGGTGKITVVGTAEWLHYSTTRSNGLYNGEYDAGRYMADVRLSGMSEGDWFYVEYGGDLRLIHQANGAYTEYSGGTAFADVDATSFTSLKAIGNLKLGVPMGSITPYVEATGYFGLYQQGDITTAGLDDGVSGRLGVGLNADLLGGTLSLRSGAYFDGDGYKGVDAGLNFSGSF